MAHDGAFILGLESRIPGSAWLSTEKLYDLVGHNVGNLAFHHAIDRQMGGLRVAGWDNSAEKIAATGSIGIIPAANQVGPHADFGGLARRFENLDVGLVAIGLGAQSKSADDMPKVPEGTLNWIRSIVARSPNGKPNISVRGPFTQKVLDHYGFEGHSVVLGCPSLFINPDPELGAKIEKASKQPARVAVASGHPNWGQIKGIEQSLARVVTATGGSYVGQATLEMVKLSRGEALTLEQPVLRKLRDYILPELTLTEFGKWANVHGNVFFDVDAWMEHYRCFDLVIGARIHGTMLAIQAGVPGVCIAHDSRTMELCQTMMIPYIQPADFPGGFRRSDLNSIFRFDGAAFDKNRQVLAARYVQFLEDNGLAPEPWLKSLAKV